MGRTGLVNRIEAVGTRAAYEVAVTYVVLQVVGETLVDEARRCVGWIKYFLAVTPRG